MSFGPRDVPGVHFGKFVNFNVGERFGHEKVIPFGDQISPFDDFLAMHFLSLFWLPNFLTFCGFGLHLGTALACFLEGPGTLKIKLQR